MASYDFSKDRDKLQDLSGGDRPPYKKTDLEREGFVEQSPGAYVDGGRNVVEDPKDPAQMLHDMRVEEQERAEIRRMRMDQGKDPFAEDKLALTAGTYDGAGGYKYEVMGDGQIKIVGAPGGKGVGVTLKAGHPAHEAISAELSQSGASPSGESRQGEADLLTSMEGSKSRREESARSATGVTPGEGRSGEEMARVRGLSNEDQIAELDRGRGKGNKVSLSDTAQAALDRTREKNRS